MRSCVDMSSRVSLLLKRERLDIRSWTVFTSVWHDCTSSYGLLVVVFVFLNIDLLA